MNRILLLATVAVGVLNVFCLPNRGSAQIGANPSESHRPIAIEVCIVEIQGADDSPQVELSGPIPEVAARIRELESKGQVTGIERVQLTTVENQSTRVQVGKGARIATGRTFGGPSGFASTAYQQMNVGTMVVATARIDGDSVIVELQVEKSQLEQPRGDDEAVPQAINTLTCQTTAQIETGTTIVASGFATQSGESASRQLVLASARILGPKPDGNP